MLWAMKIEIIILLNIPAIVLQVTITELVDRDSGLSSQLSLLSDN